MTCPHGWPLHMPNFIHEYEPGKYAVCRKAERDAIALAEKAERISKQ